MSEKVKDWKIIITNFDLNKRVQIGLGNYPSIINQQVEYFNNKKDLVKTYNKIIKEYLNKSYDWNSHGEGAMKFYYYDKKGNDIYTLILAHYKNEEITEGLLQ